MLWLRSNAAALGLLVAFATGFLVNGWYRDSVALAETKGAELVRRQAEGDLKVIAGDFHKNMAELRALGRKKQSEVKTIIERPVYLNVCIDDDGLQILNGLRPH